MLFALVVLFSISAALTLALTVLSSTTSPAVLSACAVATASSAPASRAGIHFFIWVTPLKTIFLQTAMVPWLVDSRDTTPIGGPLHDRAICRRPP